MDSGAGSRERIWTQDLGPGLRAVFENGGREVRVILKEGTSVSAWWLNVASWILALLCGYMRLWDAKHLVHGRCLQMSPGVDKNR